MKVLVLGSTGATGRLVVRQLISRSIKVKTVIRKKDHEFENYRTYNQMDYEVGDISQYKPRQWKVLTRDCHAVVSCLGHNLSFRGLFGKPRLLVTDCIKNVCESIKDSGRTNVKVILMNTTANSNVLLDERYSIADKFVLTSLKFFLPPHLDNIKAAGYLAKKVGLNHPAIEWCAVRPDTLINEENVSYYEVFQSPERSPVFKAGKTSRINVSHFITELITNNETWQKWAYKMPVLYNHEF